MFAEAEACILREKLILILRGMDAEACLWHTGILLDNGLHLAEITFDAAKPESWGNTAATIAYLKKMRPEMHIGAGTVLTVEQVDMAADAGAEYIISPDTCPEVIKRTKERGMLSIPGALTPTDMTVAQKAGADFVKLFPAGAMGPAYVKAVLSPLNHLKLLVVGGISAENVADFLKVGALGAGVGGAVTNKKAIAKRDRETIEQAVQALKQAVNGVE